MQDELPLVSLQTIGFCDSPWKDKARMWAELLCELLGEAYPLPNRLHRHWQGQLPHPPLMLLLVFNPTHSSQRGSYVVGYGVTLLHFQYIFNLKCFFHKTYFDHFSFLSPTPLRASPPPYPPNIIFMFSPLSLSVSLSPLFQNLKKKPWNTNENQNKH